MAAERTWDQACEALRTSISEVIKDSESALDEFRQLGPETANYTSEMQLLERRLQWLSATVDSEHPERLPEMIAKQKLPLTQETAGETRATTEDMSAIGRAPPCSSWMSLRTISGLLALGTFRSCKSTAEIKEKNEELKKEKGYILDLVAGTKTALNDMKTAKKRAEAAKKKRRRGQPKRSRSREKRMKRQLIRSASGAGPVAARGSILSLPMRRPCRRAIHPCPPPRHCPTTRCPSHGFDVWTRRASCTAFQCRRSQTSATSSRQAPSEQPRGWPLAR